MPATPGSVLVTGANGGLGSAIAEAVASEAKYSGYHGIYLVRDAAAPVLSSILARNPSHSHDVFSLELTNLEDVRQIAAAINSRVSAGSCPPIRALILNAGFQDFGKQSWTEDGFDKTFSANCLGHWLLTLLLLRSMDKEAGRIVVVGSQSHDPNDSRNAATNAFADEKYKAFVNDAATFESIAKGTWSPAQEDPSFRSGFRRYGAAKLYLVMMIYELQRRMDRDPALNRISILGVDPGTMSTGLQRLASWPIRVLLFKIIYPVLAILMPSRSPMRTTKQSASHTLQAALDVNPVLDEYPKSLYFNGTEPWETSAESRDVVKRDLVWKETVRYAHLQEDETVLPDWQ